VNDRDARCWDGLQRADEKARGVDHDPTWDPPTDQAQELRDLLEAALDPGAMVPDRQNATYMLIQQLQVLDRELAAPPADGAEPDRAAAFERARRAALEVRPNEQS
jgi:hypothetical protein